MSSTSSASPFSDLRVILDGDKSIHDLAAQYVTTEFIKKHSPVVSEPGRGPAEPVEPAPSPSKKRVSLEHPICIIGAGCAGLYAGMILDSLGINNYVILEASNRIGGRLFTHRFNGAAGFAAPIGNPARYDYVDMGAMRFPETPFMNRVFSLFRNRLNINEGPPQNPGVLIPYIFNNPNTFRSYNGIDGVRANAVGPPQADAFEMSEANGGNVPAAFVDLGPAQVGANVYRPFANEFTQNGFQAGWNFLTAQDAFTVRGYMLANGNMADDPAAGAPYPPQVVDWLETFRTGTGLYNLGFVQSTMSVLDFGFDPADPNGAGDFPWFCIDGGSDRIITAMVDRINQVMPGRIITGRRVTATARANVNGITVMQVTSTDNNSGQGFVENYSQVICTVPLGCLAVDNIPRNDVMINIPRNDLRPQQRAAIRALSYGASTKVAIRFAQRWWEDPAIMGGLPIQGGVSSGDIPIRTCVYPSYGLNVANCPGALLASYAWAQDAQRLGGLAQGPGTPANDELLQLTLSNLSQLHGLPVDAFGPVLDNFATNWHNDVNSRGANAAFGPGQFGNADLNSLYVNMKIPAPGGLLHFAGDAVSVHHAWVLGALNSGWRAVFFVLGNLPNGAALRAQLVTPEPDWNLPNNWDTPNWGIPNEENIANLLLLEALV